MSNKKHEKIKEILSNFKNIGENVQKLINSSRFPYTFHHDWYRMNIASSNTSRSDIASIMNLYDEEQYANKILQGAFAYMFEYHAEDFLNDLLNTSDNEILNMRNDYLIMKQMSKW